jgi:DNA-binding transcriptional ArsR family regulator
MQRREATPEEAKALAHPLRLRILRLCLDESLTNKQLAERLGRDPATLLHHVRTLERTGFVAAEPERRGARGARERPYRATGKSWTLSIGEEDSTHFMAALDAFYAEVLESPEPVTMTRMSMRLRDEDVKELGERLLALIEEFMERQDPSAAPYGFFLAGHKRGEPAPGA